uniref:RAD51b protein n=1 Tax=Mycena chlorophos TaxID=658473 RepID=A0ABQ0MD45_MYCCL|nr:RAD51b protein [Mycena chlorophos]
MPPGNIQSVAELLLCTPQDLGRRCRLAPLETTAIFNAVCNNNRPELVSLADRPDEPDCCTTGDADLDAALAGGFRCGMLWEVFGEGGAGKTQLALQQALFVQLPVAEGGLAGSACYITINSSLHTPRLLQLMASHPLLSSESCSLDDIQTISSPTIPILISILSKLLPDLVSRRAQNQRLKPVKLVVIDALADLFFGSDKASTGTLVERSQNIVEIAGLLHSLASAHNLIVLALNTTTDIFQTPGDREQVGPGDELQYKQQSRWFGAAASIPGENSKEASLGLAWANQINARIMMSRTGRRRFLEQGPSSKRQKVSETSSADASDALQEDWTMIRRLSVVFSSVGPACSVDYIVSASGISTLSDGDPTPSHKAQTMFFSQLPASAPQAPIPLASQLAPLDVGSVQDLAQNDADDYFESYFDDIPDEFYDNGALGDS